ncbi:S1C family serine protease [Chamaesiphon sp.]|uniref:S1C family serine protease n=1 Tax=Chamaesiphon sp. TaxID=2814140 RepID=UPI003593585F
MNQIVNLLPTLLLSFTLTGAVTLTTTPLFAKTPTPITASRIYERVNPAVVMIRGNNGRGSGFIIRDDGLIVTNAHVVKGEAEVVTVMMADGKTEIPADVVGFANNGVDLALLKINRSAKFPTVSFGNTGSIKVGNPVYAIGTPLQELNLNTFTSGIVSAIRTGDLIQHNAAINSGNSGGPLLNDKGQLIGVNVSLSVTRVIDGNGRIIGIATGNAGLGYALSVDLVRKLLVDFAQGKISPVSTIK